MLYTIIIESSNKSLYLILVICDEIRQDESVSVMSQVILEGLQERVEPVHEGKSQGLGFALGPGPSELVTIQF